MKHPIHKFSTAFIFTLVVLTGVFFSSQSRAQLPYIEVTAGASRPLPIDYFGQNAANIIDNRSLNDTWLRSKIPRIHPGTIRHVASSPSNWWDWRSGWLLTQENMLPGYEVRDDWAVLAPRPDKISDLKYLVDTTGTTVIFVPNLLTSRLDYQLAALFEFADKNLLAPYVEMGCEFYLDNNEASQRFPTSIHYADTVTKWIDGFRTLFPNLKIAAIGATEQGNNVRRNTWTQNVIDHAIGYDAISLHAYISTGLNLPDSIIPQSVLPDLFAQPFKTMESTGEVGKELAKINDSDEVWISEYNLTDQRYVIHGHWAHALFLSALTLSFLSDSQITHVNQFRMSGDAYHGDLFETNKGFKSGPAYKSFDQSLHTNPNEFTAGGNAMQLIGTSLHLATAVSPLIFTPYNGAVIAQLSGGYSSLYGYKITKPVSDEMILVNLSGDSALLDVQGTLDSAIVNYEILWWQYDVAKRPLIEITGDMPVVSGIINNSQIYIPPYSIMRLYQCKNEIYAKTTDDTICEGSSTTILAYGASQYSWSPSVITAGDQAVAYISPVSTTTYTVTGTQGCTGGGCTKLVTIHVVPHPVQGIINVVPSTSVCPGTTVTLSVQQTDANKFCWTSPEIGSQFAQSSITVMPGDTTTYYVFGAKNGCYSYRDSVTIYIRPSANAGPDVINCSGDSILLGTTSAAGLAYAWSPSTGLSTAYVAQPLASPLLETTYVLTVTDLQAGCSDMDTITVDPVQCCQTSGSAPVFASNTTATFFLNSMLNDYGANVDLATRVLNNYPNEIFINGIFVVDSNLSIFNCPKIKFGEKARIYVTGPDVKLKFKSDSLQSCGSFKWSGIVLNNILSKVIFDSTYVANADTVLLAMNDADYEVRNSHFHDNNCAVAMINYVEELEGEEPEGKIYGSTFEGSYSSSRGINIENVNLINIGKSDQAPNVFHNLYEGLHIQNADALIVNNQFYDLQLGIEVVDTFSNPDFAPVYTVTVGGDLNNEINSFEKISVAILADDINLIAKENTFTDCIYGIWAKNCIAKKIEVSKNSMSNTFRGVNLIGNKSTSYVIKNNTIATSDMNYNFFPVAINVTDFSNAANKSGSARVTGNEIFSNGLYGIRVCNNNGYGYDPDVSVSPQITGNSIHLGYSGIFSHRVGGIRLENCINNAVGDNEVEGAAPGGSLLEGINLFAVSGAHLFCNSFDSLGAGIVFIGTNNNDSTWSNIFSKTDSCIKVGQTSNLYGKLNDQSGNSHFASGNQFKNATDLHLIKLDPIDITYYMGNNELYPPLNISNFNILYENLPVFTCLNTIGGDSAIQYLPDSCADSSATHATIQAIVEQYPVNGTALVDDNEALLWQVAYMCPLECGEDIFIARSLLETKYDNLIFNDDSLCFTVPTVDESTIALQSSFYSVYPNPASTQITIQYFFSDDKVHTLGLSDLSGRLVATYSLPAKRNTVTFSLPELGSGCYLLSIYESSDGMKMSKLIIAK